jgi:hypothetical protein
VELQTRDSWQLQKPLRIVAGTHDVSLAASSSEACDTALYDLPGVTAVPSLRRPEAGGRHAPPMDAG